MRKIKKVISKLKELRLDYHNKRTFFGVADSFRYTVAPYAGGNAEKHNAILGILETEFHDLVAKYAKQAEDFKKEAISDDCPIWVLWWQGKDEMPQLVKACYQSILNNAGKHPVHLITKHNISQYTNIPKFIYDKMEAGRITFTHFSDIVRMNLLQSGGGIWMDATILVTQPIGGFKTDFVSIKQHKEYERYVCGGNLWTAYMLAFTTQHPVASFAYEAFLQYWQKHDCLIDYYLVDYVLTIAYRNIPSFRQTIEQNGYEYERIYEMASKFYAPADEEEMRRMLQIPMNKLQRRNEIAPGTMGAAILKNIRFES